VTVASKETIQQLKRRHRGRLLRLSGVNGIGIQRGTDDNDYVLVIHVTDDDEATRAAIREEVDDEPVRIVKSGTFKKM
jgi:hypothetical protein